MAEFPEGGDPNPRGVTLGFVKPLRQAWRPLVCSVVGDRVMFEGCIILHDTLAERDRTAQLIATTPTALSDPDQEFYGAAIRGEQYRWPDRTIPYRIDPALPSPERVTDAIAHWEQRTPIRFKLRTTEVNYVVFRPGSGCASSVGMRGGEQEIILGPNCAPGNVIHEIGHTVGLWHEQSRIDRDAWIRILWANVRPEMRHNFEQHVVDGEDLGTYDFGSIMHYPPTAFSANGHPTIAVVGPDPGVIIGQRCALSSGDIAAVASIYP